MSNSWDDYYNQYSDWDDARCFNVRISIRFEEDLKGLGYNEHKERSDFFLLENNFSNKALPQSKTYKKKNNEIILSFDVPYDWSIDTDWEDKALVLLGLNEEWVIDSSVEDK